MKNIFYRMMYRLTQNSYIGLYWEDKLYPVRHSLKEALVYMGDGGTVYFDGKQEPRSMYVPHNSAVYYKGTNDRVNLSVNFVEDEFIFEK